MIQAPIECPVCFESYSYYIGHDDVNGNTFVLNAMQINPEDNRAHLICITCLNQLRANQPLHIQCPMCRIDLVEVEDVLQQCTDQNLPRAPLPSVGAPDENNIFLPIGAAPAASNIHRASSRLGGFEFEESDVDVEPESPRAAPAARRAGLRRAHYNDLSDDEGIELHGRRAHSLIRRPMQRPPMPWYIRLGVALIIGACLIILVAAVAGLCALILRGIKERVVA